MANDTLDRAMLPCPFCGGPGELHFSHEAGRWDIYEVECLKCDFTLQGPLGFEGENAKLKAVSAWNTRTSAPREPIDDLERIGQAMAESGGFDWSSEGTKLVFGNYARAAIGAMVGSGEPLANRMWSARNDFARFEDRLEEMIGDFDRLGHDDYDESLEIHGVQNDIRLSGDIHKFIADAGFRKVYVNHLDGWETHYSNLSNAPVRGWRRRYVSDPKAKTDRTISGDPEPGYYEISYWPEGWSSPSCQDWLATGYMRIVPDPLDEGK